MGEQGHQHGVFAWHQLLTTAPAEAAAFYQGLLGWTAHLGERQGVEQHTLFNGDRPVASILGVPAETGEAMPHWHPHLSVDDVDKRAQLAEQLGGRVVVEPMDIPGQGRLAVIQDPGGAVLTLVSAPDADDVPDAADVDGD
jgi:predicted enzyme related to lactoylglutathione lyase